MTPVIACQEHNTHMTLRTRTVFVLFFISRRWCMCVCMQVPSRGNEFCDEYLDCRGNSFLVKLCNACRSSSGFSEVISRHAVASPGFVARRGKDGSCHGALTMDFRAGCSSCSMTNSFVTKAVLIERAVSC